MPWKSSENFQPIRVDVQMQVTFNHNNYFTFLENTDQKVIAILNLYEGNSKFMRKMIKNSHFVD